MGMETQELFDFIPVVYPLIFEVRCWHLMVLLNDKAGASSTQSKRCAPSRVLAES